MSTLPYASRMPSPDLPFSDQRGGLKTMGVVLIVLGCFSGCLAAIMIPSTLFAPRVAGVPAPTARDVMGALLIYLLGAALLISIGAGSLKIRRWSRAAILVVTGTWAATGLLGFVWWLFAGPSMEQAIAASTPAGATTAPAAMASRGMFIGMVVGGVFMAIFMVLLPAGFFWFYQRESVRQTLDYFDPGPAWTDHCPTPVLAMSFWLALGSIFALNFCVWAVFPAFGVFLSGTPAIAALTAAAIVLAVLAWGMFFVNRAAWWATAIVIVLTVASTSMTFARVDPLDMYRLSGSPPEQIEMMRRMGAPSRTAMMLSPILYGVALFAYLMWIRKFFRERTSSHSDNPT